MWKELGSGGTATVYEAEHGGRRVALKVLHPDVALADAEQKRFFAEVDALAAIHHPSVVRLFEHGVREDGRPFIAMELIDGETLATRLERGALPREEALRRFAQLASGVAALHEAGLVHRDLKPGNVMCAADRTVLLDLGIAKKRATEPSTTTRQGLVRGTPDYMAPERLFGAPASEASDIYELALVLYLMLAGRAPWDDPTDPSGRHDPTPLGDPADAAILRALSVGQKARPASVRELVAAIEGAEIPERGRCASKNGRETVETMALAADGHAPRVRPRPRWWLAGTVCAAALGWMTFAPRSAAVEFLPHAASYLAPVSMLSAVNAAPVPSAAHSPKIPHARVAPPAPPTLAPVKLGPNCRAWLASYCKLVPERCASTKSTLLLSAKIYAETSRPHAEEEQCALMSRSAPPAGDPTHQTGR